MYLKTETTSPQSQRLSEPRATVWIQPFSTCCPGASAHLDMFRLGRVKIMQLFQSHEQRVEWQGPGCWTQGRDSVMGVRKAK